MQAVVFVPFFLANKLRMLKLAMEIILDSTVGYIGLQPDESTVGVSYYYSKMPEMHEAKQVFLLDPMLATAGVAANRTNV